jgi:hypothetical protein
MSWNQVSANTVQNCLSTGDFCKKSAEEIVDIQPHDMTVCSFEASVAIDENISVAFSLTEDDICQTVTSAEP